jgi:nucleotide-binding universal stress UspA family protein
MASGKLFRSILVAYDGTPAASGIVDTAMSLAKTIGAKLIVLGIVPPLSAEASAEGWGLEKEQQFRPHLEAEMDRLTDQANKVSVEITTEIVSGNPDETIEQRARAKDVDLVVVGHRTMTRVRRWFEGKSTAEGLVSSAKTSVLVIPEPDASRYRLLKKPAKHHVKPTTGLTHHRS